jgi:hypothetical protein
MPIEYEVFSKALDAYLEPVVCRTSEDANAICAAFIKLTGASCGWEVREVEAGKRPIPPVAEVPTPVLVDEVRKLMAKHGQNLMVTFAWNATTGVVNIGTAGDCRKHSEYALALSNTMVKAAGLGPAEETYEDRRAEHKS